MAIRLLLGLCFVVAVGSSCSYSQTQTADGEINKDYQDYLVKKEELILFEKARTARELKEWK